MILYGWMLFVDGYLFVVFMIVGGGLVIFWVVLAVFLLFVVFGFVVWGLGVVCILFV